MNPLRDMTTHELVAELGQLIDEIRQTRVPATAAAGPQRDLTLAPFVDDITILVAREQEILRELRLRRNATRQVMAWYRRRDERQVRAPLGRRSDLLASH